MRTWYCVNERQAGCDAFGVSCQTGRRGGFVGLSSSVQAPRCYEVRVHPGAIRHGIERPPPRLSIQPILQKGIESSPEQAPILAKSTPSLGLWTLADASVLLVRSSLADFISGLNFLPRSCLSLSWFFSLISAFLLASRLFVIRIHFFAAV